MSGRRGGSAPRASVSRASRSSFSPAAAVVSPQVGAVTLPDANNSWDISEGLKSYGVPLATAALCGVGAIYFAKRMSDLETKVDAGRRNNVRHLNETDVRLIVQQMAKDGLVNIPQWNEQGQNRAQVQTNVQAQTNVQVPLAAQAHQAQVQAQAQAAHRQQELLLQQQQQQHQLLLQQQRQQQQQQQQQFSNIPVAASAWRPKSNVQQQGPVGPFGTAGADEDSDHSEGTAESEE